MSAKYEYRAVLNGFEKYSWDEQIIAANVGDFEAALFDLNACKACDGKVCRTSLNHQCSDWFNHIKRKEPCTDACYPLRFRGYTALQRAWCARYDKPYFAVSPCPGHVARQAQIIQAMTSIRGMHSAGA